MLLQHLSPASWPGARGIGSCCFRSGRFDKLPFGSRNGSSDILARPGRKPGPARPCLLRSGPTPTLLMSIFAGRMTAFRARLCLEEMGDLEDCRTEMSSPIRMPMSGTTVLRAGLRQPARCATCPFLRPVIQGPCASVVQAQHVTPSTLAWAST